MEPFPHADWCCAKGCPGEQESLCTSPSACGEACTCSDHMTAVLADAAAYQEETASL